MTAARGQRRQRNTRRGMACLRASTQGTAVPGHGEPQGMLLTAVRTAAVANDEPWHGTSAERARQGHGERDAEVTVQRQSSNAQAAKESTERCRAQPLATRMRDPAPDHDHSGAGQGAGRARPAVRAPRVCWRGEQQPGRARRRAAASGGQDMLVIRVNGAASAAGAQWLWPARQGALASQRGGDRAQSPAR